MNINDAFPSDYLRASDLQGHEVTVTIGRCDLVDLGAEEKPCLHFVGKDKGMILNKTNARTIADMHGPDTDNWYGKKITLFAAQVDFQGKSMLGLRVKIGGKQNHQPKAEAPAKTQPKREPRPAEPLEPTGYDDESDIPF